MATMKHVSFQNFLWQLMVLLNVASNSMSPMASSVAGQETLLGIRGSDFILLGADSSLSSSSQIAVTVSNLDKIVVVIDPPMSNNDRWRRQQTIVAAAAGDAADVARLLELLAAHAQLREYEAGLGCDVECIYNGDEDEAEEPEAGLDVESLAHLARGEISSSLRSGRGHLRVCLLMAGMIPSHATFSTNDRSDGDEEARRDDFLGSEGKEWKEREGSSFSQRLQMQIQAARQQVRYQLESVPSDSSTLALLPTTDCAENGNLRSTGIFGKRRRTGPFLSPRLFWLDDYGSMQGIEYGAHGLGANFALSILDKAYRPQMTREEAIRLLQDCFQQLRTRFVINSPTMPCIKCIDANGCHVIAPSQQPQRQQQIV